jgi:hypothetical protein
VIVISFVAFFSISEFLFLILKHHSPALEPLSGDIPISLKIISNLYQDNIFLPSTNHR